MASSPAPAITPATRRRLRPKVLFFALAPLVAGASAATVYFRSFTDFSPWDDEGFAMIGLRSFLEGNALYNTVRSQYGPFYYLAQAALYTVFRSHVSHDAVRALMALFWLFCAGLCAWAGYRVTRSWILTALGFTAAIRLGAFFQESPGHPEEICLALLLGVFLCACYLESSALAWTPILLGSLVAALALTKINIGAFAALAIGLALLRATPGGGAGLKILWAVLALAGLSLPIIILAPLRNAAWAQQTALFVVLSLSADLLVAWFSKTERIATPAVWAACITAGAIAAALIVALCLARGTTLSAMLHGVLLQHAGYARNWYIPFHVRAEWIPAVSLLLAAGWVGSAAIPRARTSLLVALSGIKVVVIILWCLSLRTSEWALMYNIAIPFTWLVLVPSTPDAPDKWPFARLALCLLTAFAALYLLPVAGMQTAFSVALTIPMMCALVDDLRSTAVAVPGMGRLVRLFEAAAVALVLAVSFIGARDAARLYRSLTPLALPGAQRIHVRPAQASDYQWITATLKNSCDATYSMPGIFSLYFWTQTTPPTRLLMSNWIGLLSRDEQQQVVQDLSRFERLCVVYSPSLVEFWRRGQDIAASPLARYIQDGFVPLAQRGGYTILVRRGQIHPRDNE